MTTIGTEMTHNRFQGEVKGMKILVIDDIPEHPKLKELGVLTVAGQPMTGQEKRRERRKNKRRSY